MSSIFFFASESESTASFLQTDLHDRLKEISDQIKRDGVSIPDVLRPLTTQDIAQCVIGPCHLAFRLNDGRVCRVGYTIRHERAPQKCDIKRKSMSYGSTRSESPNDSRDRLNRNTSHSNRSYRTPLATLSRSRGINLLREIHRHGLYFARPITSPIPANEVPENLIEECQTVLEGKSRQVIIRELQNTNLDVNMAVNNLLSRDDEAMQGNSGSTDSIGATAALDSNSDEWDDGSVGLLSILGCSNSRMLLDSDADDLNEPPTSPRVRGDDYDYNVTIDRRKRRRIESNAYGRDSGSSVRLPRMLSGSNDSATSRQNATSNDDTVIPDAPKSASPGTRHHVHMGDQLEFWPGTEADPSLRFTHIASLYSELVGLSTSGELRQWCWTQPVPYAQTSSVAERRGKKDPVDSNQLAELVTYFHPRTESLGLSGERIVRLSGCSMRATVLTASGMLATWFDESLFSLLPPSASQSGFPISLLNFEHRATLFHELRDELIVDLQTTPYITTVRCQSGAVFWWGIYPHYMRERAIEKNLHRSVPSRGNNTGNKSSAGRQSNSAHRSNNSMDTVPSGHTTGVDYSGMQRWLRSAATATDIQTGTFVKMKSAPIFHAGAIGFTIIDGVPKVGTLLEDAWKISHVCRFRVNVSGANQPATVGNDNSSGTDELSQHLLSCPHALLACGSTSATSHSMQVSTAASPIHLSGDHLGSGAAPNLNFQEMPPPPSPASSTCSDQSVPVRVSPGTFKRRKMSSTSSDRCERASSDVEFTARSGRGRSVDTDTQGTTGSTGPQNRRSSSANDATMRHSSDTSQKAEAVTYPAVTEEDWCLSNVVFVEDGRTQPVGVVLKVDGNIAAVKFLKEQERSCLAVNCPYSPICGLINNIMNVSGGSISLPSMNPVAVSTLADHMALLNDCRLLRKDDLTIVRCAGSSRVPDFLQRTPRRITICNLSTDTNSSSCPVKLLSIAPESGGLHTIVKQFSHPQPIIFYRLYNLTGKLLSNIKLSTQFSSTQMSDSSTDSVSLICPAEPPLMLRDPDGLVIPFIPHNQSDMRETGPGPALLDLPPIHCAAFSWSRATNQAVTSRQLSKVQLGQRCLLGMVIVKDLTLMQHVLRANDVQVEKLLTKELAPSSDVERELSVELVDGRRNLLHMAVAMCAPQSSRETSVEWNSKLEAAIFSSSPTTFTGKLSDNVPSSTGTVEVSRQCRHTTGRRSSGSNSLTMHDLFLGNWSERTYVDVPSGDSDPSGFSDLQPANGTNFWHFPPIQKDELTRRVASYRIVRMLLDCPQLRAQLPQLLAARNVEDLTPFMLAVKCRAYTVARSLYDSIQDLTQLLTTYPLHRIEEFVFPVSSKPDDSPLFMLCYNDTCSFTWTGPDHIRQDIFECRTCGLMDSLCCCTECARVCHKGHDCRLKRTSPTAYCDCWEKCRCQSLIAGAQAMRHELFYRLLEDTDLIDMKNSRNEHLLLFLVKCMERQFREQKQHRPSRRRLNPTATGCYSVAITSSGAVPLSNWDNQGSTNPEEPEHDLDPPRFARDALELALDCPKAVESILNVDFLPRFPRSNAHVSQSGDDQRLLSTQNGSMILDEFVFNLICKCPSELVDILLSTLLNNMPSSDSDLPNAGDIFPHPSSNTASPIKQKMEEDMRQAAFRFIRSVARIFTGLNLELSADHRKKKIRLLSAPSAPLDVCRHVFRRLARISLVELPILAVGLLNPLRCGTLRPSHHFALVSQLGEAVTGMEQMFTTDRSIPTRQQLIDLADKNHAAENSTVATVSRDSTQPWNRLLTGSMDDHYQSTHSTAATNPSTNTDPAFSESSRPRTTVVSSIQVELSRPGNLTGVDHLNPMSTNEPAESGPVLPPNSYSVCENTSVRVTDSVVDSNLYRSLQVEDILSRQQFEDPSQLEVCSTASTLGSVASEGTRVLGLPSTSESDSGGTLSWTRDVFSYPQSLYGCPSREYYDMQPSTSNTNYEMAYNFSDGVRDPDIEHKQTEEEADPDTSLFHLHDSCRRRRPNESYINQSGINIKRRRTMDVCSNDDNLPVGPSCSSDVLTIEDDELKGPYCLDGDGSVSQASSTGATAATTVGSIFDLDVGSDITNGSADTVGNLGIDQNLLGDLTVAAMSLSTETARMSPIASGSVELRLGDEFRFSDLETDADRPASSDNITSPVRIPESTVPGGSSNRTHASYLGDVNSDGQVTDYDDDDDQEEGEEDDVDENDDDDENETDGDADEDAFGDDGDDFFDGEDEDDNEDDSSHHSDASSGSRSVSPAWIPLSRESIFSRHSPRTTVGEDTADSATPRGSVQDAAGASTSAPSSTTNNVTQQDARISTGSTRRSIQSVMNLLSMTSTQSTTPNLVVSTSGGGNNSQVETTSVVASTASLDGSVTNSQIHLARAFACLLRAASDVLTEFNEDINLSALKRCSSAPSTLRPLKSVYEHQRSLSIYGGTSDTESICRTSGMGHTQPLVLPSPLSTTALSSFASTTRPFALASEYRYHPISQSFRCSVGSLISNGVLTTPGRVTHLNTTMSGNTRNLQSMKEFAEFIASVGCTIRPVWKWLSHALDNLESQLRYCAAWNSRCIGKPASNDNNQSQQDASGVDSLREVVPPLPRQPSSNTSRSLAARLSTSSALPATPFGTLQDSSTSVRPVLVGQRQEFLSYVFSLMRSTCSEHGDGPPFVDAAVHKHLAYVLDALLYFFNTFEIAFPSGLSHHLMTNAALEPPMATSSDSLLTNTTQCLVYKPFSSDSTSGVVSSLTSQETPQPKLGTRISHRMDSFFRRSESVLSLSELGMDLIDTQVSDSLPLATQPHLLQPSSTRTELFGSARYFTRDSSLDVLLDEFRPKDALPPHICLDRSAWGDRATEGGDNLKRFPTGDSESLKRMKCLNFSGRELCVGGAFLDSIGHPATLLSRWCSSLEFFGRHFANDVGTEPKSYILGGFTVKESRFRKQMERIRNNSHRDLTLEVEREHDSLIVHTVKQLNAEFTRRQLHASSGSGSPMMNTPSGIGRYSLGINSATPNQSSVLSRQSSSGGNPVAVALLLGTTTESPLLGTLLGSSPAPTGSSSIHMNSGNPPLLTCAQVKVTFRDEPGEGSGVARSFFTAFAEAVLLNETLPNLTVLLQPAPIVPVSSSSRTTRSSSVSNPVTNSTSVVRSSDTSNTTTGISTASVSFYPYQSQPRAPRTRLSAWRRAGGLSVQALPFYSSSGVSSTRYSPTRREYRMRSRSPLNYHVSTESASGGPNDSSWTVVPLSPGASPSRSLVAGENGPRPQLQHNSTSGPRSSDPLSDRLTANLMNAFSSDTNQSVGNRLFSRVYTLTRQEHLTARVTGMLLELPATEHSTLLSNDEALRNRVDEARALLVMSDWNGDRDRDTSVERDPPLPSSTPSQSEQMGSSRRDPGSNSDSKATGPQETGTSDESERVPLFWQPGMSGYYYPRAIPGINVAYPSALNSVKVAARYSIYRSIGRIIGLCLLTNVTLPLRLSRPVLKYILGRVLHWHDFAFYDPTAFEGLRRLLQCTSDSSNNTAGAVSDYNLNFSLIPSIEEGGIDSSVQSSCNLHLLAQGGDQLDVDESNAFEFVKRYTEFKMLQAVAEPLEQLRLGVFDVLPRNALDGLTAEDLRLLLNGTGEVDVDRLYTYTTFHNETQPKTDLSKDADGNLNSSNSNRVSRLKRWFWNILRSMDSKQRQNLLYFWTSSPNLPASAQGFEPMPSITIRPPDDCRLPSANTCISRLYLPLYSSKHILREKLLQAIETKSFGFI